jgi:outer membrane immunogenic protein
VIRKVLLSSVVLVAFGGAALAADLPSRRAPPVFVPPPIPVFTWTGFYVGAQAGYGWDRDRVNGFTANPSGFVGGGHIGYNFAGIPGIGFGNGLVVGVEGDVNGSTVKDTIGVPGIGTTTYRENIDGSARGRVGVAVDRALFFATGGAAFADFRTTYPTTNSPLSTTRVGWTVGGGIEYSFAPQWSVRAEYRYADFSSFFDGVATRRETLQRAQAGVSYHFDTVIPAPVVARY